MEAEVKVIRKIEIEGIIRDKNGNIKEKFIIDEKGERAIKEV